MSKNKNMALSGSLSGSDSSGSTEIQYGVCRTDAHTDSW